MPNREPFLRTMRSLVECYQAFEHYSAEHVRGLRLTPAQFDIVATLGNTVGMNFKELGERTLITKGTLTGVVDRMERRGLVQRKKCDRDARVTYVCLTPAGERTFARVFPQHVEHLKTVFSRIPPRDLEALRTALDRLRNEFQYSNAGEEKAA
jgi:MarR family transcriptional regulator, 2-MHQ and catechol-resistance regulon repressor